MTKHLTARKVRGIMGSTGGFTGGGTMKKIGFIILAICFFLGINIRAVESNDAWWVYQNTAFLFKINYPGDWIKVHKSADPLVEFYAPSRAQDNGWPNLNVGIDTARSELTTPQQYLEVNLEKAKKVYPDLHLLDAKPFTISNEPALQCLFEMSLNGLKEKMGSVFVIKNKKAYAITYVAGEKTYEDYAETFQSMISSFEFLDPSTVKLHAYEDHTYHFKMKYPAGWLRSNHPVQGEVEFDKSTEADGPPAYVNVVVHKLPAVPATRNKEELNSNLRQILKNLPSEITEVLPEAVLMQSVPTTLGYLPAQKVIFKINKGKTIIKSMQVYGIQINQPYGNRGYDVVYQAEEKTFDKNLPNVELMLDSFEL